MPVGDEMTWEYQSTETNTGEANPIRSVVTVLASKGQFEGKAVTRLETVDGKNQKAKTELVSENDRGVVCLARAGRVGPIVLGTAFGGRAGAPGAGGPPNKAPRSRPRFIAPGVSLKLGSDVKLNVLSGAIGT